MTENLLYCLYSNYTINRLENQYSSQILQKICISTTYCNINSTKIKTWISDISYASGAVNNIKQATTTEAYANAVRGLSVEQAKLALSTKNLTVEQQREILVTAGLIKETGSLTVAQATEALTTDTRNAADVEALMLKAGLITELGAETTATITVDSAKLKELVDTKVLTQAEAELLAMKAGVTLQSTKEAATLIASNAKLGSSFAIMGKTAGAALKGIGKGLLSFASAHPILAIGATIIGSVAFFNNEAMIKIIKKRPQVNFNDRVLGVKGDNETAYREFTIDRMQGEIDLADYVPIIEIQPVNKNEPAYYDVLAYEVQGDSIYMRWDIKSHNTKDDGSLEFQIYFGQTDDTSIKVFQTYTDCFAVAKGIEGKEIGETTPPDIFESAVVKATEQANASANSAKQAEAALSKITTPSASAISVDSTQPASVVVNEVDGKIKFEFEIPKGEPGAKGDPIEIKELQYDYDVYLDANEVYNMTIDKDCNFILPSPHVGQIEQILIVADIVSEEISIVWGTDYFFNKCIPAVEELVGECNIIFESNGVNWCAGAIPKGTTNY